MIGSLELLGDGGTGNREPQGIWMAGGVVRRSPFPRCGVDDPVAARGVVLDVSIANEFREDGGDGGVSGRGALADLALRERGLGVGEYLDDALLRGVVVRRIVVCGVLAQPQGGPLAVIGEFELDIVESGGGAVLDGHDDLPLSSAQVQIAVAPGMELAREATGACVRVRDSARGAEDWRNTCGSTLRPSSRIRRISNGCGWRPASSSAARSVDADIESSHRRAKTT